MHPRRTAAALAFVLAFAACSGGDDGGDRDATATTASGSTSTTGEAATTTTADSTTTTAAATAPPAGGPSCPPTPARAALPADRPRYTLRVDVRPAERRAEGDLTVRFTPDLPTDRLVFRLWPNGPRPAAAGAQLDTGPVTVDGAAVTTERPDATTLVVLLGRTLAAGETVEASLPWSLRLPGAIDDRVASGADWARLGSFFPILPWEAGVGWAMDPPTSAFAEASVAPTADFDVRITVPAGLEVLSSGRPDPADPAHHTAEGVRDFALSVGRFEYSRLVVQAPDAVDVVVGVDTSLLAAGERPEHYAAKVAESLRDFANQFGPYPWPTYTLAITPDLGGGIEYPAHVMQGPRTISRTTSHEVAHMWFYALVGNNQGRDPWLDEGLASYAEARWEGTAAEFTGRSIPADAAGRAGEPMTYWERRQRSYYRGVYVQPAAALLRLGDVSLVDCALRIYVAREAFGIARPADFFEAVEAVFPDARARLAPYGLAP